MIRTRAYQLGDGYAAKYRGKWRVELEGPWSSTSNPEGIADTPEEAKALAVAALREMRDEIAAFLDSPEAK